MKYLLANLVLLASFLSHNGTLKEIDKGYGIGDYATDFSLPDINGKKVSLADFKDAKGYLVIFTCNTCPYSIAYEDRIIALDKKYKTKGVPVIAINPNDPDLQPADDVQHMKKRAMEKGFTFPYLVDEKQEIFPQYGATKTPHVYLLEKTKNGNVVRYIGTIDDNYSDASSVKTRYVENAVDAMLSGEEIPLTTTRAIGCSIKSRK
ncbi:thioredoxin family protein [Eudoraea adriatica]|uniref:thioredoxin family protein n=1 Tax=Eudoraea adriatica TaxID=446681 RepID=UPI00035FB6BD|nr:thioredoxin family protein [Eudoraea adriatica]